MEMNLIKRDLERWLIRLYCRIRYNHRDQVCIVFHSGSQNKGDIVSCSRCYHVIGRCGMEGCKNHPDNKIEMTSYGLTCQKCGDFVNEN